MRDLDHVPLIGHLHYRAILRFWKYVDKSAGPDACWPWTASLRTQGDGRFKLAPLVNVQANRVAYALANGVDPGPMFVLHSCDYRRCCNPKHLFLGTHDDNMADMTAKGRHFSPPSQGERNGNAKLTDMQTETVKAMICAGKNNKEIARAFGVTHQLISRIRRGKCRGTEPMSGRYASLKNRT